MEIAEMKKWWRQNTQDAISNVLHGVSPLAVVDDDGWGSDYLSVGKICELVWLLDRKQELRPSEFPMHPDPNRRRYDRLFKPVTVSLPNVLSHSPLLCREKVLRFAAMPARTMPPIILYYQETPKFSNMMLLTMKPEMRKIAEGIETVHTKYIDGVHRLFAAFERGDKTVPLFIPSWQDVKKVKI